MPDPKDNAQSIHARVQGLNASSDTWQNVLTDGSGALIVAPIGTISATVSSVAIAGTITANVTQTLPLTVNVTNTINVSQASPLTVNVTAGTINVSAVSLPLPSGASTLAEQQTQTTALQLIDNLVHTQNVAFVSGVPIMAHYDDTLPLNVSENFIGTLRMSPERSLHVELWEGATQIPIGTALNTLTNTVYGTSTPASVSDYQVVGAMALNDITANTYSDTDSTPLHVTAKGALWITQADQNGNIVFVPQASTATGQRGSLSLFGVHTSNPTYTNGTINMPSLTTSGHLRVQNNATFAEDATHTSGDLGAFILAVRNDTLSTTFGGNGDYSPIAVGSKGQVFVTHSDGTNFMPTMDVGARSGFHKIFDGSGFFNLSAMVVDVALLGVLGSHLIDPVLNVARYKSTGEFPTHPASTDNTLANSRFLKSETDGTVWTTDVGGRKTTYRAASLPVTITSSATDIFTLTGSASRAARVTRIKISGTQNAQTQVPLYAVKRSTADTGGSSTTLTAVNMDASDVSATVVARTYTANPTVGTLIGNVDAVTVAWPTTTMAGEVIEFNYGDLSGKQLYLSSTSQQVAIFLNSATILSGVFLFTAEWTEDSA